MCEFFFFFVALVPSSLISMLCLMVYMLSPIISMLRVVVSAAFLLVQILHRGVHVLLPMIPCNQRLRVQAKYHKMLKNALPWPPMATRGLCRNTVPKAFRPRNGTKTPSHLQRCAAGGAVQPGRSKPSSSTHTT